MAIFRAGKRVGPFDIRVGFPRDKSLDNVDRDPRLKQRANTENTIGRFRAAMAKAEGYARPARFAVKLFLPSNLSKMANLKDQSNMIDTDPRGQFSNMQPSAANPDHATLQDLASQMGTQMNIHCDSVSMPGKDLVTQKKQFGNEPEIDMVVGHAYSGTINASFYADKYLRERQFFEHWQKLAVDTVSHKANYYDNYVGKMHMYQLGADSEVDRDMPTYAVEAIDVYPEKIGALDYGHALGNQIQKITIEFSYKQWFNMGLESARGLEFGQSQQSAAVIKARDKGLFGKLPVEIQRAGKDIFQQGRTVFNPIGRIFKGKVFPPFT